MKILSRVFLLMFLATLTACGFHLRGFYDMPSWLNDVAIVVNKSHRDLPRLLQEQLESYKIRIVPTSQAKYLIIIQDDNYREEITSVSSTTNPRQYQIIYTVYFMLQVVKGKMLIPAGIITVTRQLTVNTDRILGSDDEESVIKAEMRQDAVLQIINRLSKINKEEL